MEVEVEQPRRRCIYCLQPTAERKTIEARLMGASTIHRVPVCSAAPCQQIHSAVLVEKARQASSGPG